MSEAITQPSPIAPIETKPSKISPERAALYKRGDALKAGVEKYDGDTAISNYAVAVTYNAFSKKKINLEKFGRRCRVSLTKKNKDDLDIPIWGLTDAEIEQAQLMAEAMITGLKASDSIWYKEHFPKKTILNPTRDNGKVTVDVNPESNTLTQHSHICVDALANVFNKPQKKIFVRNGILVDIFYDEKHNVKIAELDRDSVRCVLDQCCNFVTYEKTEDGDLIEKKARPPRDVCENLLAMNGLHDKLPSLIGITESPYITQDGIVVSAPGYNETTGLYFVPSDDYKEVVIPDVISKEMVSEAVKHVDGLFSDFMFEDNESKDNAVAALVTSILRPTIDGCTPLFLVDKPQMGTGGSLLCEIINRISTGKPLEPSNAPKANDGEEWEKLIVSILSSGTPSVCFDNIESNFQSAALASVLTSRSKKCRVLGSTNHTSFGVNVNWMGNGINLNIQGDMPRRIYLTRLITDTARPQMRTGFKIPDIKQHVIDHRYEYIKDVLVIAKAYHNAGCPQPKWNAPITGQEMSVPAMGSFEKWRDYIGGIMVYIEKIGFLGNMEKVLSDCESQTNEEEELLEQIYIQFKDVEFSAKSIMVCKDYNFSPYLPSYIQKDENGGLRKLGWHLSKINGRVFPNGYKISRGKNRQHIQYWNIEKIDLKAKERLQT